MLLTEEKKQKSLQTDCKYIVFEGMDAAGKNTQSKLTAENLGYELESFPNYESGTGKLVRSYLTDSNVTQRDMSKLENVKLDSALYTLDRANWLINWYDKNKSYVFDRYYTSNILYQTQLLNDADLKEYCDWLTHLETVELGLPKPDIVICLLTNPSLSIDKIHERGRIIDKFENYDVQRRIYNNAHRVADLLGWKKIYVSTQDGNMRSIEDINQEIMNYIL